LIEEMLMLSTNAHSNIKQREQLNALKTLCLNEDTTQRPLFKTIYQEMIHIEENK